MVNINMSDPRIAMGVRAPSIPTSFSNALMNIKNLGENREIATARKQQRGVDEQQREFKSLVNIAQQANTLTSPESKLQFVKQQQARAQEFKLPTPNLDQYISMAESGDIAGAQSLIDNTIQLGMRSGLIKTQAPISRKISAPIPLVNKKTGEKILVSPSAHPITGEPTLDRFSIPEGFEMVRETPAEKRTGDVTAAIDKETGVLNVQKRIRPEIEGGIAAVKQAVKVSGDAFNRLEKISTNIGNFDEAIRLIDEGAQTGVITNLFPSFKQATIQLNNLQGRLGLDVIGNTTFGALSESELKFALDTALPKNLSPPDLRKWIVRKKEATQKLSNYIADTAQFLGKEGNTVSDWIELQKVKQLDNEKPPVVFRFDGQGNPIK